MIPQYRVHARLYQMVEREPVLQKGYFISGNGPFDYRCNAIEERNRVFNEFPAVYECWITKDWKSTGKKLQHRQ